MDAMLRDKAEELAKEIAVSISTQQHHQREFDRGAQNPALSSSGARCPGGDIAARGYSWMWRQGTGKSRGACLRSACESDRRPHRAMRQ